MSIATKAPRKANSSNENVVAAHTRITDAAKTFERDADALLARIQEQEESLIEAERLLATERELHARDSQRAEERYIKETGELKVKLASAEDKLKRIFNQLA